MRYIKHLVVSCLLLCALAVSLPALAIGPAAEYYNVLTEALKLLLDRDVPSPYEFVSGYRVEEGGDALFLLTRTGRAYTLCIYTKEDAQWQPAAARSGLPEMDGIRPHILGVSANSFYLQYEGGSSYRCYTFDADSTGEWHLTDYRYERHKKDQPDYMFSAHLPGSLMKINVLENGEYIYQTLSGDLAKSLAGADIAGLPVTISDAFSMLYGSGAAVVSNPNPRDRLHLREKPDKGAASLGKFYNGVVVTILEETNDAWVKVSISGALTGYMQKQYLAFGESGSRVNCVCPVMKAHFIAEDASLPVWPAAATGKEPVASFPYDTQMEVLGIVGDDWAFVRVGTVTGYMEIKYLWEGNG